MKRMLATCLLLSLTGVSCGNPEDKETKDAEATNAASSNPLAAPADYVGALGKAMKHSAKVVDTVQIKQAVDLFQASEDRYPATLDELVQSGYLPSLPEPPTGAKLEYNAATGEVKIVRPQ